MSSRIGLDIDSSSVFHLLLVYRRAKALFPDAKIETEVSSSGHGFHIRIYHNRSLTFWKSITYRAILDDDPFRIIMNLKKYFMSGGKEKYNDILFNFKSGKMVKQFDLERIIKKHYRGDIRTMSVEKIEQVAEKIEEKKEIPTSEEFLTCTAFSGESLRERIKKVNEDTRTKDPSWKWKIYQNYHQDHDFILVVSSPTKDQAMKRGVWLVKKVLKDHNLLFWVKKKK